ncbi:RNA-dependent ATPase rok1 [Linnemannia zychae]|nr:RNA-dependent ATPase rok1 [Linnemannia zychae]
MQDERAFKKARLEEGASTTSLAGFNASHQESTTIASHGQEILGMPFPFLAHSTATIVNGHYAQGNSQEKDPLVFFSEEIALHILEMLTPAELAHCACVSRQWYRLVNDQMLWRRLFYKDQFIYPRGFGNAARITKSTPIRNITTQGHQRLKRKQSAFNQVHRPKENHFVYGDPSSNINPCWKALYRLNHNWIAGQAQVTSLSIQQLSYQDQLFLETSGIASQEEDARSAGDGRHNTSYSPIVQFQGPVLLIASPRNMVHLWRIKSAVTHPVKKGLSSLPVPSIPSELSRQPEFWQTYRCSKIWRDVTTAANVEGARGSGDFDMSVISCLAMDRSTHLNGDSTSWQKVMVGYSSGHFSIFEYSLHNDAHSDSSSKESATLREIGNTMDLIAWSDVGGIQSASFLYPILITCSDDGTLSIYKIQESYLHEHPQSHNEPQQWCRLLHRLYGSSLDSPVEMELRPVIATPHSQSGPLTSAILTYEQELNQGAIQRPLWQALITFGLQLMDGSWTVRLQEIEFDEQFIHHSTETGVEDENESGCEQTCFFQEADDNGPMCERIGIASSPTELLGSCLGPESLARIPTISAITISSPYVVTTHPDNTMNVFHMARLRSAKVSDTGRGRSGESIYPKKPIRFRHLSTLYGHCGAVSSVAIESRSGRLVSASMDRSIKVWTMVGRNRHDQLEQRRVHHCALSMNDLNQSWALGARVNREEGLGLVWVGTDEEKIVSMNSDGTVKCILL